MWNCFAFCMEGNGWRFQNVKRYLFPCLRYKTCRGIDIWLRSFLSSTPDGVEWSTTGPVRFITRKMPPLPNCPWNWWLGRCQNRSGYLFFFVCNYACSIRFNNQCVANLVQGDQKCQCTWWLQYRKLQVMFKVSPASLQTFIDTPNCVLEDRVQYSTVHIPNVFCDGQLHHINCVGIVRMHWVFRRTPEKKKSGGERSGDLGGQMVLWMILSANTSSKNVTDICAVWAVARSCSK